MTRVKICGIMNEEDAQAAVEAGADAIGFVFADSPRRVSAERAGEIMERVSPFVTGVGVFVDATVAEVREALEASRCTVAQLHGSEDPRHIRALAPTPVIKAIRVTDSLDGTHIQRYNEASAILLDTYVLGQPGGTGRQFDPSLAARFVKEGWRVIVAGGLTPENVGAVVARVRPHGVDASSGVECAPGRKDHVKMQQFVAAVRAADEAC